MLAGSFGDVPSVNQLHRCTVGAYGSDGSRVITRLLLTVDWGLPKLRCAPEPRGVAGHGSLALRAVAGGIGWSKIMHPSMAVLQLQLSKHVFPYANGAA